MKVPNDLAFELRQCRGFAPDGPKAHPREREYPNSSTATPASPVPKAETSARPMIAFSKTQHGKFDIVAAWSVDRLGRSLQDLVGFLNELESVLCDFYLHQQSLDTTTPSGRAMF